MVEVKRIKAPNDIPAYGGYVMSWCCTDHPRWTGNSEGPNSHGAGWKAGQGEA
jgi:hypothetical protein